MIRPALVAASSVSILFDIWMLEYAWSSGQVGTDFAVFWRAAHGNAPYAASLAPFASPPTALLLFQPFRLASLGPCLGVFTILGVTAFLWSSARLYGHRAALLALLSPAFVHGLLAGQVSMMVAAIIFVAFLCPGWAGGALLALAVCLKPQMCFLAPLMLVFTRRWSALASFALTALLLCALATAVFGLPIWVEWRQGTATLLSVARDRGALWLSVSPAGFGFPWLVALPVAAISLFALRNARPDTQGASLVAVSLLAAPYALTYDLVAVAPFAALTLLGQRGLKSWGAAAGFSAVFGPLGPIGTLIAARQPQPRTGAESHSTAMPRSDQIGRTI